jgi:hypothetical protein
VKDLGPGPFHLGVGLNDFLRAGATGSMLSLCDADTLKMLGATGRLAARASFVDVPDRDDPHHASRVPQASFKLLLPGLTCTVRVPLGSLLPVLRDVVRRAHVMGREISLGRPQSFGNAGSSHRSPAE